LIHPFALFIILSTSWLQVFEIQMKWLICKLLDVTTISSLYNVETSFSCYERSWRQHSTKPLSFNIYGSHEENAVTLAVTGHKHKHHFVQLRWRWQFQSTFDFYATSRYRRSVFHQKV